MTAPAPALTLLGGRQAASWSRLHALSQSVLGGLRAVCVGQSYQGVLLAWSGHCLLLLLLLLRQEQQQPQPGMCGRAVLLLLLLDGQAVGARRCCCRWRLCVAFDVTLLATKFVVGQKGCPYGRAPCAFSLEGLLFYVTAPVWLHIKVLQSTCLRHCSRLVAYQSNAANKTKRLCSGW